VEKHLPNLTFEEEIYFSEDQIRIIYTPGHTVEFGKQNISLKY